MRNPVGAEIFARRKELGLGLREVAREAGHSHTYQCDLEYGRRLPSWKTTLRLNKVLKTQLQELVREAVIKNAINAWLRGK